MSIEKVQEQFGKNAGKYVTSTVHAKGYSLQRLVELINPQPHWHVLDIATGGGHTALTFAPHVNHVWATDVTPQMLQAAGNFAQEKGVTNLTFEEVEASQLPYQDHKFDLITCRIAPHHFTHLQSFVNEAFRTLKSGGKLAVVDNIVPGSQRKGKKARQQQEAGHYINAIETLRDPSHHKCLSITEWQDHFYHAGFSPVTHETAGKKINFASWANRMPLSPANLTRLKAMFLQAPPLVANFLQIQHQDQEPLYFHLTEIIIIGTKPATE